MCVLIPVHACIMISHVVIIISLIVVTIFVDDISLKTCGKFVCYSLFTVFLIVTYRSRTNAFSTSGVM